MDTYILYAYCTPNTESFETSFGVLPGTPFYIGIGKPTRQFDHLKEASSKNPKCTNKINFIKSLIDYNTPPKIIQLMSGLTSKEAKELEIKLIAEIGTQKEVKSVEKCGPLFNLHKGGGGGVGKKTPHSLEARKKISLARTGIKNSETHNRAISIGVTKALNAPGMHEKLVEAQRTKTWSVQHSLDAAERAKNIVWTDEHRQNLSKSIQERGYTHSEEMKELISARTQEAMDDPEVKEKMIESSAKRWNSESGQAEKQKIADKNSRSFQLTDKETGETVFIKNMSAYSRETGLGHWFIHKKYNVIKFTS